LGITHPTAQHPIKEELNHPSFATYLLFNIFTQSVYGVTHTLLSLAFLITFTEGDKTQLHVAGII
jgi:hypothetical protein